MADNPDYWNTIATVIPVIALTYSTALKRGDWHRLKPAARRWTALYGAGLVGLLVWTEWMSLEHLQAKTTGSVDEAISLMVVGWAAAHVLALPIAPLLVIALHDLHPKVLRIKRERKFMEREFYDLKRRYEDYFEDMRQYRHEALVDGSNDVFRDPSLVFESSGRVRENYRQSLGSWALVEWIDDDVAKYRSEMQEGMDGLEKRLQKSAKRLQKSLRSLTKNAAKITDMHR